MRFQRLSPWMFGFVAVPYGVVSALITTVMPFLFRKTGFELEIGTAALMYSFSAIAKDYMLENASLIGIFSGIAMVVALALGSLVASKLNHRFSPRKVYLVTGLVSAAVSVAMAFSPLRPVSYFIGVSLYLLVGGVSTASFYAVVFETIGHADGAFSTYYTLFVSVSNAAIAYVTLINGKFHRVHGTPGLFLSDAVLNCLGALIWVVLLVVLFRTTHKAATTKGDAT